MKLLLSLFLVVAASAAAAELRGSHGQRHLAGEITRLRLIDAKSDLPIAGYDPIPNGATIPLPSLPSAELNIEAITNGAAAGKVAFFFDGVNINDEGVAPYAMCGDNGGNFNSCTELLEGQHAITAKTDNSEVAITISIVASVSVTNAPVPATNAPVPAPTKAPVTSPTEAPAPAPTISPVRATDAPVLPEEPTFLDPSSCGPNDFQNECTTTGGCKGMAIYSGYGATDCSNRDGGVCYCGDDVCGCLVESGPVSPAPVVAPVTAPPVPAPPTKAPVSAPVVAPVTAAPVPAPPTNAPVPSPTNAPVPSPTNAPVPAPTMAPVQVAGPGPIDYSAGNWVEIDNNAPIDERHEACFVMVGPKAYLVGGRGNKDTDIYDPRSQTWSKGATPPIQMHHMQCVAAQGKLWVMAAWTDWYPRENNPDFAYVYDPAKDEWQEMAAMPGNRRRGAAAVVVSEDESKIYVSHGNNGGHETGDHATSLGYLDEYTIASNSWKALSNSAPNPRDHTCGALINGRICVAGGRNGGEANWPEVAPTDCYDLATGLWNVEASIPQVRGGSSCGTTCDGKLMIAGGEGGGNAWDNVDIFDGTSWTSIDGLAVGRHGSGLAFACDRKEIFIASGAAGQGGGPEIKSLEVFRY